MIHHPWHLVSSGENTPEQINTIIEIPRGSKAKYELDKTSGLLRLDRVLQTNLTYPAHYGFIPQTLSEDNDPLDAIILCSQELFPLSIVEIRVLGAVNMIDNGEQDDKILGVAARDPLYQSVNTLESVPEAIIESIIHFFKHYKEKEHKKVIINELHSQEKAYSIITKSIANYHKAFGEINEVTG